MLSEQNVNGGIIEGKVAVYDENGVLTKEYYVTNDSIKNGTYKEYYPSGMLSVIANFKDNNLDDMMYYFNEKGDTIKYYKCNAGKIIMPYKKWLDNSRVLIGSFADSNHQAVVWKWYNNMGKEVKRKVAYSKERVFIAPE